MTNEQFSLFEKIFKHLNEKLFDDKLPAVLLNFSRSKTNVFGFFHQDRWIGLKSKKLIHEISINPSCWGTADPIETLQTLAHEMTHLWQHVYGNPSRTGYHNAEWAGKMIEIGLQPDDGKGKTTGQHIIDHIIPGGKLDKIIQHDIEELLFPLYSTEALQELKRKKTVSGSGISGDGPEPGSPPADISDIIISVSEAPVYDRRKRKYTCPECSLNVWGKPGLLISCKICAMDLIESD